MSNEMVDVSTNANSIQTSKNMSLSSKQVSWMFMQSLH